MASDRVRGAVRFAIPRRLPIFRPVTEYPAPPMSWSLTFDEPIELAEPPALGQTYWPNRPTFGNAFCALFGRNGASARVGASRASSAACRSEVGPDRFRQRGSWTLAASAVRIQG